MAPETVGLLELTELRDRAAHALAPVLDTDPVVLADIVDSLTPPALMIAWGDPWLEPGPARSTMGPCMWTAVLRVLCIAGRLEPGPGYEQLEQLVSYVLERMRGDSYPWALDTVEAPAQFDLSAVTYLAATVVYRSPVTV